jgi:tetratricopeptide (TPR) repeat protein
MRRKTQQRLTILAVILLLVMGTTTGIYLHLRSVRKAEVVAMRGTALGEFAKKNYPQALVDLMWYANRVPRDADAYYALATCYDKLRPTDSGYGARAIDIYRLYFNMVNPAQLTADQKVQYDDARHEQMKLFVASRDESETVALATAILKDDPEDKDAIECMARAYSENPQHYPYALERALEYDVLDPADLDMEFLTMRVLSKLKPSKEQLASDASARSNGGVAAPVAADGRLRRCPEKGRSERRPVRPHRNAGAFFRGLGSRCPGRPARRG